MLTVINYLLILWQRPALYDKIYIFTFPNKGTLFFFFFNRSREIAADEAAEMEAGEGGVCARVSVCVVWGGWGAMGGGGSAGCPLKAGAHLLRLPCQVKEEEEEAEA